MNILRVQTVLWIQRHLCRGLLKAEEGQARVAWCAKPGLRLSNEDD